MMMMMMMVNLHRDILQYASQPLLCGLTKQFARLINKLLQQLYPGARCTIHILSLIEVLL